jgi:hypothetical protein
LTILLFLKARRQGRREDVKWHGVNLRACLEDAPVLLPFVTESVNRFDNAYFRALLDWNANNVELGQVAFIPTDVVMVVDPGLR